jgi:hypothetical protein
MRIRRYSKGKFYLIECAEDTRIVRCHAQSVAGRGDVDDVLVAPFHGHDIRIPTEPPELLALLADAERCGLSLVGAPVPDVSLAGAVCPGCHEDDVSWLSFDEVIELADVGSRMTGHERELFLGSSSPLA